MRLSRLVASVLIAIALATAIVPLQATPPSVREADCCAGMKIAADGPHCAKHAPKSAEEQQCCAACILRLGLIASATAVPLYPPRADQSFAPFLRDGQVRFEKPPVPPPRSFSV